MKDRGFILINVLVIVAALSVVAVGLLRIGAQATVRLAEAQNDAQARERLDAGVRFVTSLLSRDATANSFDHRQESWALEGFEVETKTGRVRVTVIDLESRLNLNQLLETNGHALQVPVENLTRTLGLEAELAAALFSRYAGVKADENQPPSQNAQTMYQTGDMTHMGGLAAVAGWAQTDIGEMETVFSTLPRSRKLNVNTASDQILLALPGMTREAVAALNEVRQTNPLETPDAMRAVLQQIAPTADGPAAFLDTSSSWFQVETQTERGDLTYRGQTIASRSLQTGLVQVHAHYVEVDG